MSNSRVPLYFHRSSSVGGTWIPEGYPLIQTYHFLHDFGDFPQGDGGKGYATIWVGRAVRFQYFNTLAPKIEEAGNVGVIDQRLADIVNLPALVVAVGIRQEGDGLMPGWSRGKVEVIARWTSPDGVKFCFDKYTGAFPDCPPRYCCAAVNQGVLWDNEKAFVHWLIREWLASGRYRYLVGGNAVAECHDVLGAKRGRA